MGDAIWIIFRNVNDAEYIYTYINDNRITSKLLSARRVEAKVKKEGLRGQQVRSSHLPFIL